MNSPTSRESRQVQSEQPEALRLIEQLPDTAMYSVKSATWPLEAIAELKRLHLVNQELVEALEVAVRLNSFREFNDHIPAMKAAIAKARNDQ